MLTYASYWQVLAAAGPGNYLEHELGGAAGAYTPLTRLLHASYTPLTRLLHASYTPLTRLLNASCRMCLGSAPLPVDAAPHSRHRLCALLETRPQRRRVDVYAGGRYRDTGCRRCIAY
jgi:hypothetical protein